jgi:peroxiredoxin
MKTTSIQSVNTEINDFINKMGLPEEVIEVITRSIVHGQNGDVKGLNTGDIAPDFTLDNIDGNKINLYQLLLTGPVVISFFRGAWCPFCNLELQALQSHYKDIKSLGASLVSIHPQEIKKGQLLSEKHNLEFPVLSDLKQQTLDDYKVKFKLTEEVTNLYKDSFGIDLSALNANGMWNLPVPATFIVDTNRVIKARHFSHDYMVRMEPTDILDALENLPNTTGEKEYIRSF